MALNQDVAFKITAEVTGQQAVDKLSAAIKNLGNQGEMSTKQWTASMRMVPAQLTDIATQLAGGQSPFLIMMQQGGQLRDMFGSVSGALFAVGSTVAKILTPMNAALAVFTAIGYAVYKGADQSQELNRQLLMTGSAAGYTAGQIEKMAVALRDAQGISAGTSRDLVTGLAASGQFVGKNLDTAAEAAAKLQKLTSQSSDEIIKDFEKMSGGVAAWAAEHNKSMNFLTVAQFRYIQQLEQMGKKEEAMAATIKALDDALDGRKRNLGYLETAWKAVGNAASNAWNAMLGLGREETIDDKIKKLQDQLAALDRINPANRLLMQGKPGASEASAAFEENKQRLREQIRLLQQERDKGEQTAAEKAKEAAETRQKIEEELSGKANATRAARLALELSQLQGASESRLAVISQEKARLEALHGAGMVSEESFINQRLNLQRAELAERAKLIDQEIALEKRRPINSPADAINQQARIQQLMNQKTGLLAQGTEAGIKAQGELQARTFASGWAQGLKDYVDNTASASNQAKTLFTNATKGMEDAMVNFVKTGKLNFASLADSIISDLIRIAVQNSITKPLASAMGGMNWGSIFSANGNIVGPDGAMPLKTYANGGIAKRPQVSIFGEGSTPEAYVPLPDGRSIPVSMRGGGGANVVVNVNNNAGGTQATTKERTDSNGNRVIDVFIEQVKNSIAADITRGTGTVTSALERTYGANRAAGAY
jgi:lambda family phage tail tape measure protein